VALRADRERWKSRKPENQKGRKAEKLATATKVKQQQQHTKRQQRENASKLEESFEKKTQAQTNALWVSLLQTFLTLKHFEIHKKKRLELVRNS